MLTPWTPVLPVRLFVRGPDRQDGVGNMALDDAVLDWVRAQNAPVMAVRTYTWSQPTWSVGAHQPQRDASQLRNDERGLPVVVRPTGGRAILHDGDCSFAVATNLPGLLQLPLSDSYRLLMAMVQTALARCGADTRLSKQQNTSEYVRSAACFATHTPSDLLDSQGRKLVGSAQVRRRGGLLQHGAMLSPHRRYDDPGFVASFHQALVDAITTTLQKRHGGNALQLGPLSDNALAADWRRKQRAYSQSAQDWMTDSGRADKASTTSGSHLLPASL
ncbi:MAG: biotin/lipoate A/B protein ligase family protein [Candidatus Melainabacteria bacterium]